MTTILAASGIAVIVLLAGNLPWSGFGPIPGLMAWNLRIGTGLPWAVIPGLLYLSAYWLFISGKWASNAKAEQRRTNLRAKRLHPWTWVMALASGALGFAMLLAFLGLVSRLVNLPAGLPVSSPPEMPVLTMIILIIMASVVAGVSEEAAFRGYMQSMIERRYGLTVAILANGTLFGLLHFGNHPGDVLMMLPYYVAVAGVYGGLTWAADSILPAIVLHSIGDIIVLTRWWITGLPEWQLNTTPPPLVWDNGIDASFMTLAAITVVLAVLTIMAYRELSRYRAGRDTSI